MKTLGNILWLLLGGLGAAFGWLIVGLIAYITIIGIPFGRQCFKFASLMLTPFGAEVNTDFGKHPIANTLWIIFVGLWMALGYVFVGVICLITIIGIPFGLQWFKLAKLAFTPFGATIKQ